MKLDKRNLKKRKEINEAMKEVMGVEKNPYINYLNTIAAQSKILKTYKDQKQTIDYGLNRGLIKKVDAKNKDQANFIRQQRELGWIKAPESLGAMFYGGDYFIRDGFNDLLESHQSSLTSRFNWFKEVNLWNKKFSTIYTLSSHVNNFGGALVSLLNGGYINPKVGLRATNLFFASTTIGDKLNLKSDDVLRDALIELKIKDAGMSSQLDSMVKKSKEGLSEDQISLFNEVLESGDPRAIQSALYFVASKLKKGDTLLTKLYQATDNLARTSAWLHELDYQAAFYKGDPNSEYSKIREGKDSWEAQKEWVRTDEGRKAMLEAKRKMESVMPTYDKVPEGLRWMNENVPVIGTFTAFPAEAIRTGYNSYALGAGEIMQSMNDNSLSSTQKALLRLQGSKRIAAAAATQYGFHALSAFSAGLIGLSEEDEEALKALTPEWDKDSPVYWYINSDGQISYKNLSSMNSYQLPYDIMDKFADGEVVDAFQALANPFFNANKTANEIVGLTTGTDLSGRVIYNEADSFGRKAKNIGLNLVSKFGTLGRGTSLYLKDNTYIDKDGVVHNKVDATGRPKGLDNVSVLKLMGIGGSPLRLGGLPYEYRKNVVGGMQSTLRRMINNDGTSYNEDIAKANRQLDKLVDISTKMYRQQETAYKYAEGKTFNSNETLNGIARQISGYKYGTGSVSGSELELMIADKLGLVGGKAKKWDIIEGKAVLVDKED